ncbi:hypothetical protein L210DRAFT_3542942 [Boletus edulis BED1]|uniref:Secreted protein n=1 Tax=Boletus edulis BED1 TaxID=1328754 RepID=A0AAD4BBE4_BOLED|nr:hypothetical protein L210DRAFT_3582427 [Boletus edulis BED1]KAF8438996.1 hypothetical protein L210DRAFT_3542942 [Boletus edulis BED1]
MWSAEEPIFLIFLMAPFTRCLAKILCHPRTGMDSVADTGLNRELIHQRNFACPYVRQCHSHLTSLLAVSLKCRYTW